MDELCNDKFLGYSTKFSEGTVNFGERWDVCANKVYCGILGTVRYCEILGIKLAV